MIVAEMLHAARALRRRPAFTAVIVVTLGLCIGANTAIFSVVNAVLLEGPAYHRPDRLVHVSSRDERRPDEPAPIRLADYLEWRRESLPSLGELGAYYSGWQVTLVESAAPERLLASGVSANLFRVLGVAPVVGRTFTDDEELTTPRLAILGHSFWLRRFGGDATILGRQIVLGAEGLPFGGNVTRGGDAYTVVGVMPASFELPAGRTDLYVPLGALGTSPLAATAAGDGVLDVVARLSDRASVTDARRDLGAVARQIAEVRAEPSRRTALVTPLRERMLGDTRRELLVLFCAVATMLLIGCVNVAGLLLARTAGRAREIAVRAALGAGRRHLVSHLLAESVLLALVAGVLAALVAFAGVEALVALAPSALEQAGRVAVDARVLAFTASVSFAAGMLCGLLPALHASRTSPNAVLGRGGGRGSSSGPATRRARAILVVAETALGIALVVCAGLLGRSFLELRAVDPGFRPDRAFATRFVLSRWRYPSATDRARVVGVALERLKQIPLVAAVGATSRLPLHGTPTAAPFVVDDGAAPPAPNARPRTGTQSVSSGYFRAAGIPLRAGRDFDARDAGPVTAERVAIVNEAFARRHLAGRSPLGARLRFGGGAEPGPAHVVIGVVADARDRSLREPPTPQVYFDYRQSTPAEFFLIVRTPIGTSIADDVRRELTTLEPVLPAYDAIPLGRVLDDASAPDRFTALLIGLFAGLALLLAAVGMFGTMAEAVTARTRELGVRMALGAPSREILRLVLRDGGTVVAAAVAVGVPLAWAASRGLRGLLYGIGAADPITYATAVGAVVTAALLACYIPARRASRVDPLITLRGD